MMPRRPSGSRPAAVLAVAMAFGTLVVTAAALPPGAVPPGAVPPGTDHQAVIVEVPQPTGTVFPTTSPGQPCPSLGRGDFTFTLEGDGSAPATTISGWTGPVRVERSEAPTRVTVALRDGVELPQGRACSYPFSLASYRAAGGASPGTLTDRASGSIEQGRSAITLVVGLSGCLVAIDLYTGTTRYDPAGVPAAESIATWSGDRDCAAPGLFGDLAVIAVPPCPESTSVTWVVVNPNDRAVSTRLATEGSGAAWSGAVLVVPGTTPVIVAVPPATAPVLAVTWLDDAGTERTARSGPATPLSRGTVAYDAACLGGESPAVTVTKTAVPTPGATVEPGASLLWTVSVVNRRPVAIAAVDVVDILPPFVTLTDPRGATVSAGRLAWRVDLPANGSVAVGYAAVVDTAAPAGFDLVNSAVVVLTGQSATTVHHVEAVAAGQPLVAGPGGGGAEPRSLSFTGADIARAVTTGVAAIMAGVVLLLVIALSRRFRDPQPDHRAA